MNVQDEIVLNIQVYIWLSGWELTEGVLSSVGDVQKAIFVLVFGIDLTHRWTRRRQFKEGEGEEGWRTSIEESFCWRTERWPFPVPVECVCGWSTWIGRWWYHWAPETCVYQSQVWVIWAPVRPPPKHPHSRLINDDERLSYWNTFGIFHPDLFRFLFALV